MRRVLLGVLLSLTASCSGRDELSEKRARATAEALIAANQTQVHDLHRMEWKRFDRVSRTEARGTAVLVYEFRLPNGATGQERIPGTFVYKKSGKNWVLQEIHFPNPNNLYHRLEQDVFVKVGSADVAPGSLEGQLFARSDHPAANDQESRVNEAEPQSADNAAGSPTPLSSASARRAAVAYLASTTPVEGAWSARGFGAIQSSGPTELELPATLLVATERDTLDYHGAFSFTYDTGTDQWMLTRLSFRAPDSVPIEESLASPRPVN